MKITRRQLKQIILEAFKDLSSILPGPEAPKERPRRRISRRDPRTGRPIKSHPIRGMVPGLSSGADIPERGVPATINKMSDVRFDDRKAQNLTKDSPFVAGSDNYHATYEHTYTADDLAIFIRKLDPETGTKRFMRIVGDYPDHTEGSYVIIPSLFSKGKFGVAEIMASYNLTSITLDGEKVKIPVVNLKTITSGRHMKRVGKAFVKKIAGSRSIHKAREVESMFRPANEYQRE